ncbi:uncharacterized protein LOC105219632 [Zeugodacus cucurbitae]|uniref:uncharacterized protein LOC105219632 n=1 Tax=Zeugodacus cucurbitae TaxID=28588 RepID=UPI0023D916CA|nr:uncharacterized protein LOC105219632 [Zeugodacus cucurbitae]
MRVLTLLLFLAVIILISNAAPPKKRRANNAVSAPKRPFKSAAGRQNSAAARAFSGPKSAKSKQFKKATGPNNRRSLQKRNGSGSSNNGNARRPAAARSRIGSKKSRPNPANNKRRGPGAINRNRRANRPSFPETPDDALLGDDEQYLDELPDNNVSFDLPEYKDSIGNKPRGPKTSTNRTSRGSNNELFDDLILDDDFFGNITDYDDLSELVGKYNASNDAFLKGLNLYDGEENGGKTNVSDVSRKSVADLSEKQFNELLKNMSVEFDSVEGIDAVDDGTQNVEEGKKTEVDKPPAESGAEEASVEKNIDDESGKNNNKTVGEEGSAKVQKPSDESSDTQPTGKISDEKDYDFDDLGEEELPEGDYEGYDEDDDKKV